MKLISFILCFFVAPWAQSINSQSYFKDTITELKTDFFNRAKHLMKSDSAILLGNVPIVFDSKVPSELLPQIDYLLIPSKQKKNLVVIQSGIHGIEGYAGAGIQNFLLEYLHSKSFETTSFLYIHLANPAGTYYARRTNLNNVDLNRNFVTKDIDFTQKNEDYATINSFLNPDQPFQAGVFRTISFYIKSLHLTYKHSIETLRRSILKGQYTHPHGVYFGGQKYQPEFVSLTQIWETQIQGYDSIIYIDLHTGYGEKGRLHLLSGRSDEPNSQKLVSIFSPTEIDFADKKNFYETTGDVLTYFQKTVGSRSKVLAVTFEFGTLNSQSTMGSLDSLYRMVSENQAFHHQAADEASSIQIKKSFRDMFYPPDFEWRDKTLIQTRNEIDKIIKRTETGSL